MSEIKRLFVLSALFASISLTDALGTESTSQKGAAIVIKSKPRDKKKPDGIHKLATKLNALEQKVEELSSEVYINRQKILEEAKINNYVEIHVEFKPSRSVFLESFDVRIDQYLVYSLNQSRGTWVDQNTLIIYKGPISPGEHNIYLDVAYQTILSEADKQNLGTNMIDRAYKDFKLEVSKSNERKKIIMAIEKSKQEKITLNFREEELKESKE